MSRTGRPMIPFNWDEVIKLMSYQCTQEEVAAFFGASVDTFANAVQREFGMTLSVFWTQKRAMGRAKLRKLQFEIVEKGGPGAATMAIWLDKKMNPDERPDKPAPLSPPPGPAPSGEPPRKRTFAEFCVQAGYPKPFEKQCEMASFGLNETDPRLLLGSRNYGKTDYVTILGVAWEIYCDWFDFVHFRGEEKDRPALSSTNLIITKAAKRGAALATEVGEALVKNGVELEIQNASVIRVKGLVGKDHSFEALSIRASFRGRHPKRIIMDDPVTEEDVSEASRDLVERKYNEAMKLSKNMLVIGQPAHEFDLYAKLRGILKKMEVPWGTIPALDADLEAMAAAGVDPHSIEMSYHLRVPKAGASIFADLKFVDTFPDTSSTVAFLDPSDGGDFTALTIMRAYMEGVVVRGRAWKRAWYHVDELVEVLVANKVTRLAFETNATGNQPIEQLQKILAPHGIGVVAIFSTTQKHATIKAAGMFAHQIHLSRDSDKVYTDQVVKYAYRAKNDDAPDSLARCLQWLGLLKS